MATDDEVDALTALEPPTVPGRSTMTHYAPGAMTLDVESATDGILVVSECHVTGWQATLDGAPAPLYVANHAFHARACLQAATRSA